ncbi:Fic/DOC family protein, partial [Maritalea sp.]|uniref:Fic/DOC family protein n=1 Tax=Maritalea sp. TaxID=2003361 RepID=UPI003EFA6AB7
MKDPYLDPSSGVLFNRLGITDSKKLERIETELSGLRGKELLANPLPGKFDQEHLKAIHRYLFRDVYFVHGEHAPAFAGAVRTIGIEKKSDVGIDYPHPDAGIESLKSRLDYAFSELKKDKLLRGMEDDPERFVGKLAKHSAEIWECHPFRDGNTRTTFMFTEHLAKNAGHPFLNELGSISEFRTSIADYVRGDRAQFVDKLSEFIRPTRELSIVRSETNQIRDQGATYEVNTGALRETSLSVATKTLEEAAAKYLRDQENRFVASLEPLKIRAERARQKLVDHEKKQPSKGLFSSENKMDEWQAERQAIEKELRVADGKARAAVSDHNDRSLHREHEAQKHAKKAFPIESELLRKDDIRVAAKVLSDRWRSLEKELSLVSSGRSHSHNNREILLRQSMDHVFSQIDSSKEIRLALGKELVSRIQKSSLDNSKAMDLV